jgi:hypothetical protein
VIFISQIRRAPLACGTFEVRHLGELVGLGKSLDDLLIDLGANIGSDFERHHVFEAGALWNGDRRIRHTRVLVADVLNEKRNEDVVLVLAGYRTQQLFPLVGKATHFRTAPSLPRKE